MRFGDAPSVVGEDVVEAAPGPGMGDLDVRAAELRRVELLERHQLRRVRRRVEIAQQQVWVRAGADMLRQAMELLVAALAVERAPCGEVGDIDAERGAVNAHDGLQYAARLAVARQRMDRGGHDVAAGEDGVAELTAEVRVAAAIEAIQAGQPLDGLVLVVEARLPGAAMDFLQADDVRLQ